MLATTGVLTSLLVKKLSLLGSLSAAFFLAACSPMAAVPRDAEPSSDEGFPTEPESPVLAAAVADRDEPGGDPDQVDFETQILPIVGRCQPCHFEGGKMYAELPFDDPATLRELGEALFTRIKDADEQDLLRAFFDVR